MFHLLCAGLLLTGSGISAVVHGHALQPGYLEMRQIDETLFAVTWKKPAVEGVPMAIAVTLPQQCDPREEGPLVWDGSAYYARWTTTCTGGLPGGTLTINGLEHTSTDVLVRIGFADGATGTHRLTPTDPSFILPSQPDRLEVVRTYSSFGVEHILLGIDHLLFIFALLLLVKGARRIVATVTAFTVAHSITLAGVTLGWVQMPGPPVEATIALSIAFVAAEILHSRQARPGMTERYPWVVAFTFGLLHGFGFAGALAEVGLPVGEIPLALLFFNLGVEIGQLLFIAGVYAGFFLLRHVARLAGASAITWGTGAAAYTIGCLAMFWVVQRTLLFFT
ncbi:MAG: HupE/UreJ family protein [Proteobacteria bacterium]|nr:HupE/UreJ family protein [Pseudomonadota bacterium]